MLLVTEQLLKRYLVGDAIGTLLDEISTKSDEELVCQKWLRGTPPKRMIFNHLYGDLLQPSADRKKVLDVGGGLTAFSRRLAQQHDYVLADILAHDDAIVAEGMNAEVGRTFIHASSWEEICDVDWDIVIANDLFPNVDQRLDQFISRFLKRTRSLRLSLTFYNQPRSYTVRRIDADEVFCMLAWDGFLTRRTLERFEDRIESPDMSVFQSEAPSVYSNGRQVCIAEIRGDLDQTS